MEIIEIKQDGMNQEIQRKIDEIQEERWKEQERYKSNEEYLWKEIQESQAKAKDFE